MFVNVDEAVEILSKGGNVIIPTETVYGLAGSIKHPKAIDSIYDLKGRPRQNPLIVHVSNIDQVLDLIEEPPKHFFDLIDSFWPGPLTLIVKSKTQINRAITGGLSTIAIRMPNHPQALEVIEKVGPLAAPSANLSGKPSGTRYLHLEHDFGREIPVLEGEEPIYGVESTILGWINDSWQVLRPGFLNICSLEEVLNQKLNNSFEKISPGSMFKHYSPDAKIVTDLDSISDVDAILGFENRPYSSNAPFFSLGRDDEPELIAHRLYDLLRKMDEFRFSRVWIDTKLPNEGLYYAILEKIHKAAFS